MKIGLIGNMNNNNFAIMRYFRDLGADARLLIFKNETEQHVDHFFPEKDTWDFPKWQPYVDVLPMLDNSVSCLDFPASWLMALYANTRFLVGKRIGRSVTISKKRMAHIFDKFDYLVGSGISPAALARIGRSLDIFYPYGSGVEFLESPGTIQALNSQSVLKRYWVRKVRAKQEMAIRLARHVITMEMGLTARSLEKRGIDFKKLGIPMVYNREQMPDEPDVEMLSSAIERGKTSGLKILCHSNLRWFDRPCVVIHGYRYSTSKNQHWLLHALAKLIRVRPTLNPLLYLLEYGPDIEKTKKLCIELGINDHVHWLPKSPRIYIMWLLQHVDVGVGEFYERPRLFWGGTGWEVLAAGRPLLQGFRFKEGEFETLTGISPPPMLPGNSEDDILQHLLDMSDHREKIALIGQGAKQWFETHNGIRLAAKWLELLTN